MICKICSSTSEHCFSAKVLGKYDVAYYRCSSCQFVQTEDPYWLSEAYSNVITKLDIGLVTRNEFVAPIVQAVIGKWFNSEARFIDYGGGYGMLVRMMRDRGFDYYRQDLYCENLFAESFDIMDVPPFKADVLTAFEVFEHLVDPVGELEKMLTLGNAILFSTSIQPSSDSNPESWVYFAPDTGQHIAIHSRKSLQTLADRFNLNYCWNEQNIHLYSTKPVNNQLFKLITHPRFSKWFNSVTPQRKSLLDKDFAVAQVRLKDALKQASV